MEKIVDAQKTAKGFMIDAETAEQAFKEFVENMDIDIDPAGMDEDDLAGFNKQKRKIIKAIRRETLVFNADGEAVYTPQHRKTRYKDPITFHERSGASILAMDKKKKGHDGAKTYAVLGDMCGVPASVFAGMAGTDIKVAEAVFALLMD